MNRSIDHRLHSDNLKATLNCYRLSSVDSLGGPGGYSALAAQMLVKKNMQSPPVIPPPPLLHLPLLMPRDTSSKRSETYLGKEKISCFIVGGEKRLCLPQILTTVLKDFSIREINRTCAELHIYCSKCSPDQLELLKVLGVLPFNTTQCGLITKTDAERLISSLGANERHLVLKQDFALDVSNGIKVCHDCFGQGDGIFYPSLYVTPDAPCIICEDCRAKLPPFSFVTHSHRGLEKRTCHWGFDRDNWRYYINLPNKLEASKEEKDELKLMKEKFKHFSSTNYDSSYKESPLNLKRKYKMYNEQQSEKRIKKEIENKIPHPIEISKDPLTPRASAFKPWPSGKPSNFFNLQNLKTSQSNPYINTFSEMPETSFLSGFFPFPPQSAFSSLTPTSSHSSRISSSITPTLLDWLNPTKYSEPVPNVTLSMKNKNKIPQPFSWMKNDSGESNLEKNIGISHNMISNEFWNQIITQAKHFPSKNKAHNQINSSTTPSFHESIFNGFEKNNFGRETMNRTKTKSNEKEADFKANNLINNNINSNENDANQSKSDVENELVDIIGVEDSPKPILKRFNSINKCKSPHVPPTLNDDSDLPSKSLNTKVSLCIDPSKEMNPQSKSFLAFSSRYPTVTEFNNDEKQNRWDFETGSYIISWSNTQELKKLRCLLGSLDEKTSQSILHTVVKIIWRAEEKLSSKLKLIEDLQIKIKQISTSQEKYGVEVSLMEEKLLKKNTNIKSKFYSNDKESNKSQFNLSPNAVQMQKNSDERDKNELFQNKACNQIEDELNYKETSQERKQEKELKKHAMKPSVSPKSDQNQKTTKIKISRPEILPSEDEDIEINNISLRTTCASPSNLSSKDSGVHDM